VVSDYGGTTLHEDTDPVGGGSEEQTDFSGLHDAIQAVTHINTPDRWVEILAATVLALATVASAWSAYQATRWGGVQAEAYAEAGAARAESVRMSDLADAHLTIDVEYFAIWLDETAKGGDEQVVALIQRAFRPEFEPAFEAWLATDPLVNQDGPATPFEMDEYLRAASHQAEEFRTEAEAATEVAVDANQTGDNYVLATVLFASVLFFAGISTKFGERWVKITLVIVGFLAFLSGAVLLLTYPVY
jgi:hypothetical protein